MAKITYENKVALNVNSDIADVNKCNATDLNEIKNVVNENDDNTANNSNAIGTLSNLNTTNKDNLVGAINEVYQNNVYSTDETVVGKWIDGKPLYKKTFQVTTSATLNAFNDIYSANIENVPSLHFQFRKGNERYPENHQQFAFYVVNGILKEYHTKDYYSGGELTVTLEYTKTTD